MNILGINAAHSQPSGSEHAPSRHLLADGSAALLSDGKVVFASIEERHTRKRYARGFAASLKRFREVAPTERPIIDAIAFSSCCGPRWNSPEAVLDDVRHAVSGSQWPLDQQISPSVIVVGHHDSHAALGFFLSGFHRAIVAVLDGFGNSLNGYPWSHSTWWRARFERHSYYLAERTPQGFSLQRVDADAENADDVGLGECYRALTHFCGWTSYQQAGSAMALAAYGRAATLNCQPLIEIENGRIRVHLPNEHTHPAEIIKRHLRQSNVDIPGLTSSHATPGDSIYCDVAAAIQEQLVNAIECRLTRIAEHYRVNSIVLAGGTAMNCLAAGRLAHVFHGRVFIPPAPSDTGQGLGNAIWAQFCEDSPLMSKTVDLPSTVDAPFWGIPCPKAETQAAIDELGGWSGVTIREEHSRESQAQFAAEMLATGRIVATCLGRSEYGPRALGGRSILADPRRSEMPREVNRYKHREPFRPFAPSILDECMADYFGTRVESPFMSFALAVRDDKRDIIPAVIHADGTARFHTVAKNSASPLRPILERFNILTGVPLVLYTSFNRKGQPMVETPHDAVQSWRRSNIDILMLDGFSVLRKGVKT